MKRSDSMFGISIETANSVANWTYLIAGASAVVFTAVTVAASWVMWQTSTEISNAKDRELAKFQFEAKERTATLEKQASEADERSAQLKKSSDQLKLEAVALQERLEAERASRLKLQAALSSRHLSPEDSDKLATAVAGKIQQVVLSFTSDAESLAFAQDIANALSRAGVNVIPNPSGMIVPKPYGVIVTAPDPSPLTTGLRSAAVGIKVMPYRGGELSILVGEKPPPF
ncbi:hypothetical protein C7U61_16735 [Rhizobium sp. JAB6]|uniref:hypothetical protein n=1 Tax=Rhizobium sp. JAB6 TaxID=2127050 RepID=UPI000D138B00|nr:hypothetical protein [Rhizobium sp. JAB6]PST17956.1 hypothetical protein C7U61_16735 [Rhizobium sp. JAB6]